MPIVKGVVHATIFSFPNYLLFIIYLDTFSMKKDLILITTYVPDDKRQQLLRKFVYSINNEKYDIMISSHSFVPQDIFDRADYVVYEKKNDIDFDIENKFYFYFHGEDFTIKTTEVKKFNHFIPVIRHISSGLLYAKALGYDIVHYFEYDSLIEDDEELIENSRLLSEYSAVYYSLPHLSYPNSPISFNLNKISPKWFSLDENNYNNFLRWEYSTKLVEEYEYNLLNEVGGFFSKPFSVLEDKKIYVGLNSDLEDNKWVVPLYNKSNNSMIIFSWVENESDVNSNVIVLVNNNIIINVDRSVEKLWRSYEIGPIDYVKEIKIIVNNTVRRSYDFNQQNINEFIKHNQINKNV